MCIEKTIYHALTGLLLRWVKCPILAITSCLAVKAGSPAVESQNKKKADNQQYLICKQKVVC